METRLLQRLRGASRRVGRACGSQGRLEVRRLRFPPSSLGPGVGEEDPRAPGGLAGPASWASPRRGVSIYVILIPFIFFFVNMLDLLIKLASHFLKCPYFLYGLTLHVPSHL